MTGSSRLWPIERVVARLPGASWSGGEWTACCPAHDDSTPSLSVKEGTNRTVLLHCFAGCTTLQVVTALGLTMRDLFVDDTSRPGPKPHGPGAEYAYRDETGAMLFRVVRGSGEEGVPRFYQQSADGSGGWKKGQGAMKGVRRVLYRLPQLLAADPSDPVFVCEGEKDADNLAQFGVVTTTNPGGAGKWGDCEKKGDSRFSEPLRGRSIVILPDNDDVGRKHAKDVATRLGAVAASIRVVKLPGLPVKGDVSDWIRSGGTSEDLLAHVAEGDIHGTPSGSLDRSDTSGDGETKSGSHAKRLVEAAQAGGIYLFHDQRKDSYVAVPTGAGRSIVSVTSNEFTLWLRRLAWTRLSIAASGDVISAAREVLRSIALFEGPEHTLHVRSAWHDGAIWIDLDGSSAVRVDADSWKVDTSPPILFRRFPHQRPLPTPERGGDIREVLRFLRIRDPKAQQLYLAYLVVALVPGVPIAVLVICGPQGATKSTMLKVTKRLLDPSVVEVRGGVQNPAEFAQAAAQNRVLYFDNLSKVLPWLSDALCGAVTGDGWSKRTLYTDEDATSFQYQGVVGLAGINLVAERADLLDRSLIIALDPVPPHERKEERAFNQEFERVRPRIFGAMLTVLSQAMAVEPKLQLGPLPRMADFARWGAAVAESIGIGHEAFMEALMDNTHRQNDAAIEASPVASMVASLMAAPRVEWKGTPAQLLSDLESEAASHKIDTHALKWPKIPNWVTRRLREVEPNLLALGIGFREKREKHVRLLELYRTRPPAQPRRDDTVASSEDVVPDVVTANSLSYKAGDNNDDNDDRRGRSEGDQRTRTSDPLAHEWYEERAAILEFEADLPRHEAERRAHLLCNGRADS